jgi:predicted nucleic acid-binding protein
MTLVDTNVLVDVFTKDAVWLDWSADALDRCAANGPLLINEVIYAELSAHVNNEADLQRALGAVKVELHRTPTEALFLAGKAFRSYRTAGGIRTGVLPDFFIGAHALVARVPILTRDTRRYPTYFPEVELIAPQE